MRWLTQRIWKCQILQKYLRVMGMVLAAQISLSSPKLSGKLCGLCPSWSHIRAGLCGGHSPRPGLGLAGTYPPVLHAHGQHDDIADILLPHQPPEILYGFLQGPLGGNELLLRCVALSKRQTRAG